MRVFLWLLENKILLGLIVSVGGGYIAVRVFECALRYYTGPKTEYEQRPRIPGWLTGITERAVFTFLIVHEIEDIGALMAGWMGLKLAANWNRNWLKKRDGDAIAFAFAALLLGLVSLAFAVLGGRIAIGASLWW